ncbi:hypothetical protein L4Z64_001339 [Pseudomonas aeruginosa]|nr:hypothetical protein [Pseudomonas aeruginosa]
MAVWIVGMQIFIGLLLVSWSIDMVAKQLKRQNKLREAELRAKGVACDVSESEV